NPSTSGDCCHGARVRREEFLFCRSSRVAGLATLRVMTGTNPAHALLYLISSLLAGALCCCALCAPFSGALEFIVYVGAIRVLFVFVVMMLNLGPQGTQQERGWIKPGVWLGPGVLAAVLFVQLMWGLFAQPTGAPLGWASVSPKAVGISLFGPYLLAVELASMLLLAALVAAFHLGRREAQE